MAMRTAAALCTLVFGVAAEAAEHVLVEAESFRNHGGWKLDTQFIEIMGSPYLLAHGLGQPVDNATTTVALPAAGTYRVWVRTKDWVARWDAPGTPGRFQVLVDGKPLTETLGSKGAEWFWHDGGTVQLDQTEVKLALHDLTGFEGRCDAILLTRQLDFVPPADDALGPWRKQTLDLPAEPVELESFDVVVVGGGYAGVCSAVSAARLGCRVALVQNRPVLGGNGSSEIRVWAQGRTRTGLYPHLGEIVDEFCDRADKSPGTQREFGDAKKEAFVRAHDGVTLLLNHHAFAVEMRDERIATVLARDTRTSREVRLAAPLFVDCTGHGTIGALAGADSDMLEKGHMGMSNMWRWEHADDAQPFPETPWALPLEMGDFPYPHKGHAQWFWEGGFNRHPIHDLEYIRDWNFRAAYGAFAAMKRGAARDDHRNARLTWMAYIGGNRESRRLLGDVILTQEDIVSKRAFPDGCVPTTWSIDLHVPAEGYAKKFPDDPFISRAIFGKGVDRTRGYPVPYRCFYSRNVPNLFMAGRCISVTHEALGTVRVMKTCGMMGEVVGKAASICTHHACLPRDVYQNYLDDLKTLMRLPGRARRDTIDGPIRIVGDPPPLTSGGIDPAELDGLVIDNVQAQMRGRWSASTGVSGFVGYEYLYAGGGSGASIRFPFTVSKTGQYELRLSYTPHENRTRAAPVTIDTGGEVKRMTIDQQTRPTHGAFVSLGRFTLDAAKPASVQIDTKGATGNVVADAVQVVPAR